MNQTLTIEQIISTIKQMPQKDRRIMLSVLANSEEQELAKALGPATTNTLP